MPHWVLWRDHLVFGMLKQMRFVPGAQQERFLSMASGMNGLLAGLQIGYLQKKRKPVESGSTKKPDYGKR